MQQITISSILGGQAESFYIGSKGSFNSSIAIDPDQPTSSGNIKSSLSVEALKAMAYDEFLRVQVSQKNLEIINNEIALRQKEEKPAEETKPTDNPTENK